MQVPDSGRVTLPVARELAEREGYALVLAGAVAPLGSGWVVTASLHGGEGFTRLSGFRETARNDAERIDAVGLLLLCGDTAAAIAIVEDAYAGRAGSPDLRVLEFVDVLLEAGANDAAAGMLAAWDGVVPPDERGLFRRITTDQLSAHIAARRGDPESAIARLEDLARRFPRYASPLLYRIGRIHEEAGRADLAIAAYEGSLERPDPTRSVRFLAFTHTLRRLAELHDAADDAVRAAAYDARVIELWQDADPELQPVVRTARQRLERLRTDR